MRLYLDAGNILSYPTTGTAWSDLSGNSNTGTLTNGPTYSSANGGTIVFDGANDYVDFSALTTSPPVDEVTFSFAIKANSLSNQFVSIRSNVSWAPGYVHLIFNYNNLIFALNNNNGNDDAKSTYTFSINTWYVVSVVYVKSTKVVSFYVNGTFSDSVTYTNPLSLANQPFQIGGWSGGRYLNGNISNFITYNRALSAAEVLQNYNAIRWRYGV